MTVMPVQTGIQVLLREYTIVWIPPWKVGHYARGGNDAKEQPVGVCVSGPSYFSLSRTQLRGERYR